MSVTLRDAQHMCWKSFRKISALLNQERGQAWTPSIATKDLLEKAREIAETGRNLETSKPGEKPETKEMLANGLSDLFYVAFVLAEHFGIELEEVFMQRVNDRILFALEQE